MGQVGTEQTLQDIKGITRNIQTLTEILARGTTTESWTGFRQLVKDGLAQSMYPVGSQLVDKWYKTAETSYDAPWDIVHYDDAGNAYLKWHYGMPGVQFDAPEAIYYFDGTEQAGVEYYILRILNLCTRRKKFPFFGRFLILSRQTDLPTNIFFTK